MESAQYIGIGGWVALGLVAGLIAGKIVARTGEGLAFEMSLGVGGALVGGFLFNTLAEFGVPDSAIWSMVDALVGAVVVLLIDYVIADRSGATSAA